MIRVAYEKKRGLVEKIQRMKEAISLFSDGKKNFKRITKEYLKYLKDQNHKKQQQFSEEPLALQLIKLFKNNQDSKAKKFSTDYIVPDQRYYIYKLKHFASKKKWGDFDQIIEKYNNNKKNLLIPFDEIAQICVENNNKNKAEEYILLHDDIDNKIMFLKGIKCYEKAAKIAFEEESTELLLEIRMEADYVAQSKIDDYLKILNN